MTEKTFNDIHCNNFTEQQFVDFFIYLTNKERGVHTSEQKLRNAYRKRNVTPLIKKLDPTFYYTT